MRNSRESVQYGNIFHHAARRAVETYPEPEVFRYLVEAIAEGPEDPEEGPLTEEGKGLAFVYLKTVLAAMAASVAT